MIRTVPMSEAQKLVNRVVEQAPSLQLMFAEMEADRRRRLVDAAKADPKANRATLVFDPGVAPDYRYFEIKERGRPTVRFCWTVHRNAAGRFLIFRETVTRKFTKRDRIEAILNKRAAISACRLYARELREQRAKGKQP